MAFFEIIAGLLLAAFGVARDLLSGGPPSIGLKQFLLVLAGLLLAADGLVRWRSRLRAGLFEHLGVEGAAGARATWILALALLALQLFAFQHYVVDDAYITFRYAKNALTTGHVTWNPGERPVEGYSNFLWLLLSMGAMRAGLDPLLVSKLVSVVALAASAFAVRRLASRAGAGALGSRLAVLVFLALPSFAFWAMSGLETVSVVLFSLLFLEAYDDEVARGRMPWRSAVWAMFLLLSRPETPLFLVLVALPSVLRPGRGEWKSLAVLVGLVMLASAPYFAWKLRAFGTVLPNTLSAKARPLSGFKLVVEAYRFVFPFLLPALLVLARGGHRLHRQIWFAFAGYTLAALNVAPHVAHYLRFFLPVLGGVAVASGVALEHLVRSVEDARARQRVLVAVACTAFAFLLAPIFEMRTYAENEARGYQHAHIPVGRLLAEAYGPTDVLAASDCGLVPFESGMRTIDIWGLTDRRIATHGFDRAYVMSQKPDVVVIHSMYPNEFRGRETYDEAMYEAVRTEPELRLRGRWGFFGYWLWVYSRRPLATGAPDDGSAPIFFF
ncbi:MAG: hypothetical protein HZA61_06075 [Candidatus Eisenbacteria bacterium]|uniref:Glycosyltransferase RgtA/B/C/D-like domain-containing protein n=1 Tax=Eiseniibacteriota bacterium TaxID=2212470 RepID=A0A933WA69_UNCEI|nr:hypothetical protein [Candidatus Eisenbacteria bacterium]